MIERADLVRLGAFSGSALSLRDALSRRVAVSDFDLQRAARDPRLAFARAAAMRECRQARIEVAAWPKTGAWSRAMERWYNLVNRAPAPVTVLVQSLPAFTDLAAPYVVYTDRVGREGAAVGGRFRSRFTDAWLVRETACLQRAARIYTMGPSTAKVLTARYAVAAERVRVVAAGPNVPIGPMAPPAPQCRRLLFVGTQWELKGGPELFDAFAKLHAAHPETELTVVGVAPPPPWPAGVRVLGRVPHSAMFELYRRAHLVVVPTHMEAFGIALAEGLMAGVPGIGSTVGNQEWILGPGGKVVPPGDVDALLAALEQTLADYPAARDRARARGEVVRREFSWDHIAQVILDDLGAEAAR